MAVSILPHKPSYISEQAWAHLQRRYGDTDRICRVDSHGHPYIDVHAMDALVQGSGATAVINAWNQLRERADSASLHAAGSEDGFSDWRTFMTAHHGKAPGGVHGRRPTPGEHSQQFLRLLRHPYHNLEDAWAAAKNVETAPEVEDVSLEQMIDYLKRLSKALVAPTAAGSTAGASAPESQLAMSATVGDCFAQAGLWWVAVFCVALVVFIIAVIMTGGGLATVAASVLSILIGAGIWGTFAGVIALVVCLGGSFSIEINY